MCLEKKLSQLFVSVQTFWELQYWTSGWHRFSLRTERNCGGKVPALTFWSQVRTHCRQFLCLWCSSTPLVRLLRKPGAGSLGPLGLFWRSFWTMQFPRPFDRTSCIGCNKAWDQTWALRIYPSPPPPLPPPPLALAWSIQASWYISERPGLVTNAIHTREVWEWRITQAGGQQRVIEAF